MHMKNTKKKTLTGLLICIFLIAALFLGGKLLFYHVSDAENIWYFSGDTAQRIENIQMLPEHALDDYDSLRPYVEQGAKQLGVQLTEDQIDQITKLGVQIAKLDLDPEKLAGQLNGLVDNIQKIQKVQQSAGSIFTNIKTAVQGFFNSIGSWFKR